ncbi:FtsK/SpoIIIE domain-containing protein [Arthrobacter sp. zg-Y1110]|uniref:FtsK/SpoIIIE domain-containing protein n=1 Tax=Arthrobacter sp. zg-Y1110 TaxID=2886932 RepID=UPI001D146E6C|nr:FtsK/SpoIIIE domain-containing protein [Arthrobacter sp. zg-Y1110]MCC3292989.1 cell division protein FtsK [Arthrobacter sp. zg-Y1110]UWX86928.1 FtsK/SpoIIIE domain-containing protein [Arthrobacter sp. zg-Y1110]
MAARRNQAPAKPITGMALLAGTALAGFGIYSGYPGLAAVWAALIVNAWMYPPAMFTGKKDVRGYPTPGSPGETAAMNKYRFWEDLKFKLVLPGMDWLPGKKPLLSFIAAVWTGAAAYFLLPVANPYTGDWGQWVNAAAGFIIVAQLTASRRRTMVADDENPGARIDSLIALAKTKTPAVIGFGIGGLILGAVAGTVLSVFLPVLTEAAGLPGVPEPAIWILALTGGPLALLAKPWITLALEHWRVVVAAREEWRPRWAMLKQDPEPRLIDRREVGTAIVDTFDAPASVGAMAYWSMEPKISPTVGTGSKMAIIAVPNVDSNNQPMPGTTHPVRFDIVRWPSDQIPDITDPETPKDVVTELARCAIVWMADKQGFARPILDDVHLLTIPPAPAAEPAKTDPNEDPTAAPEPAAPPAPAGRNAWAVTWLLPMGPPPSYIRAQGLNDFGAAFNAPVLVDHRALGGAGALYVGPLFDDATKWDPGSGLNKTSMEKLAEEDKWDNRWIEVMKQGSNPPVMQYETKSKAQLPTGQTIHHMAFVTRQGMPPAEFRAFEPKLATVLDAAPFVAMTGFPGSRRGERHAQAFSVYWSSETVPLRPDDLKPAGGPRRGRASTDAQKWVLAGRVNEAFKVARLAERPEVDTVTCLTEAGSAKHIWKIDLFLHGGVTLSELRGQANKIRQHWGSEWLRISVGKDGMVSIVAGARPGNPKVILANKAYESMLAKLDWDQTFLDSGVSGIGGLLPVFTDKTQLPKNDAVSVIDFDLTGTGLDFTNFTAARPKLESNSGNAYVEPRRIKDKPNAVRLMVCEVNPMPDKADYDWEHIEISKYIPFATGIEGEPVEYNFKVDPHLLIAGASGGGKSVLLQSLAFGALVRGYELYVADPTKGGADFKFAEPYSKAFTDSPFTAAAMMRGIYAEVVRRKNLNKTNGVGNYRDLPEDVRPKHIVILLDEFTSLMGQDPVPAPSDDPEMDAEREMVLATNRAKTEVGVYTGKIAREARSAGVTLFLATQKLSAKMLDTIPGAGDLKVNLSRLLLGKATYGDKQSALRAPQDAPDLGDAIPPGRGLFETTAGAAMAIQAWYNPAEQKILAQKLIGLVEELTEDQKLDLAPFMPKMPEAFGEVMPEPAADKIVDLGEIEIGLDDLDWSDMDFSLEGDGEDEAGSLQDASGQPDEVLEPDAVFIPPVIEDEEAAMLLDIDGALAPTTHTGAMIRIDVPFRGAIAYRPEIMARTASIPARQVWLSSWVQDAPKHLGHLLPRAVEALESGSDDTGWWKIDAALAWIAANPLVRRIVWLDDELSQEDFVLGIPYRDIAADAFREAGVEAMLYVPDPDEGLTLAMLDEAEAFLAGTAAAPAEAVVPMEIEAPAETGMPEETTPAAEPAASPEEEEDPAGDDDWDFDADRAKAAAAPETDDTEYIFEEPGPVAVPEAPAPEADDTEDDPFGPAPVRASVTADWDFDEPAVKSAPARSADAGDDDPFDIPAARAPRAPRAAAADDDDPFAVSSPAPRRTHAAPAAHEDPFA